jgi:hypothetical protein
MESFPYFNEFELSSFGTPNERNMHTSTLEFIPLGENELVPASQCARNTSHRVVDLLLSVPGMLLIGYIFCFSQVTLQEISSIG